MMGRYPIGYLFFCGFALLDADHERIDMYFNHYHTMQNYFHFMQQQVGSKTSRLCFSEAYNNAIIGTQATSNFICNCINMSAMSESAGSVATGNAVTGLVLAIYSLVREFAQIWVNKYEYKNATLQMSYSDMKVQYPHLVLIEYQIKIMQLLIDMCCHGTFPEQVFGRIHLVAMMLPGPYERYTKKQAKKLYKSCFDNQGYLVNIKSFSGKYPYYNFHCKVSTDWHQLVLDVHKYSTFFTVLLLSPYAHHMHNHYNQTLLNIIDAGMHLDRERVEKICSGQVDPIVLKLHSWYAQELKHDF